MHEVAGNDRGADREMMIPEMSKSIQAEKKSLNYKPLRVESYPPVWQNRDKCFLQIFYPGKKKGSEQLALAEHLESDYMSKVD